MSEIVLSEEQQTIRAASLKVEQAYAELQALIQAELKRAMSKPDRGSSLTAVLSWAMPSTVKDKEETHTAVLPGDWKYTEGSDESVK
jgi:hypothetical protein